MAAWLPGAYDLRALSWAHVRVWGEVVFGEACNGSIVVGSIWTLLALDRLKGLSTIDSMEEGSRPAAHSTE